VRVSKAATKALLLVVVQDEQTILVQRGGGAGAPVTSGGVDFSGVAHDGFPAKSYANRP
jgi:hypothetical protein